MLGGQDPTFFDFYYYEDNADAITAGDLALTAPDFSLAIATPGAYINTINPTPQTIYVLVVGSAANTTPNNGAIGCYEIWPLVLHVDSLPPDPGAAQWDLCDDELQGSTLYDQISTFDLTTWDAYFSGGDPTVTITWYATPGDEIADNPILDPTLYQNTPPSPETVVVRITSIFGCKTLSTLTLNVLPNPTPAIPDPLEQCDVNNPGDGVEVFNLTDREAQIQNGGAWLITYHELESNAIAGIPDIPDPTMYSNISTPPDDLCTGGRPRQRLFCDRGVGVDCISATR